MSSLLAVVAPASVPPLRSNEPAAKCLLLEADETLGGKFGPRYPAGGLSIANAVIFGHIAGKVAPGEVGKRHVQQ